MRVLAFVVLCTLASAVSAAALLDAKSANATLDNALMRGAYTSEIQRGCLVYRTESVDARFVEFALMENHTPQCGGDPATSPVRDRYRINRVTKRIESYDVAEDDWQPYK